jgi:predicted unusual protein kinase regulating ubiquinone biosynthesis (AarF/ABC1/UbiB family)
LSKSLLGTLWKQAMHSPVEAADHLVKKMGAMRGPMVKIAQLTSMVPDLLPETYRIQLINLCDQSPPMPWGLAKRCLAESLGTHWSNRFDTFNNKARFAASLGQVHEVILHNGQKGACKIQYPDVGLSLESDLRSIGWILRFYEKWSGAIRTKSIFDEICTRMRQELDYEKEAKHMQLFHTFFKDHPHITIPKGIRHLSTKKVLTMPWLDGQPMAQAYKQSLSIRNRIAQQLIDGWYTPFFQHGWMHGDPHQGNITWHHEGINILDWGCARPFSKTFVHSIQQLYQGTLHNNASQRHDAYAQWGIDNLNKDICAGLDLWTGFLMAPFVQTKPCSLADISPPAKGKAIAKQTHTLFRQGGGVMLPADFLIFDRVAVVLGSLIMHLDARAPWADLWQDIQSKDQ